MILGILQPETVFIVEGLWNTDSAVSGKQCAKQGIVLPETALGNKYGRFPSIFIALYIQDGRSN